MDKTDKILGLQGVGWFMRKAISLGTVSLSIKHYRVDSEEEPGKKIEKIDISQTITGGIPGTTENRTLVWKEKENYDHLFGSVIGKSRRVKADDLDEEWLKEGWTDDTLGHGLVQAYAESNTPKSGMTWVGNQVRAEIKCIQRRLFNRNQTWGMEMINGERRYARHVDFIGPSGEPDRVKVKLIYDYRQLTVP